MLGRDVSSNLAIAIAISDNWTTGFLTLIYMAKGLRRPEDHSVEWVYRAIRDQQTPADVQSRPEAWTQKSLAELDKGLRLGYIELVDEVEEPLY